jgi:hypothetical protein
MRGILQVHFSEAHSFLDRELRAYRLMAGFAADAISGALEHTRTEAPVSVSGTAHVIQQFTSHGDALSGIEKRSSQDPHAPTRPVLVEVKKLIRLGAGAVQQWANTTRKLLANHVWEWQTLSAAIILAIILGIAHFHHPASPAFRSTVSALNTGEKLPDTPISVNDHPARFGHGGRDAMAPNASFRKVRIGANEVDYISNDVTIRHFTTAQTRPQRNVKLMNIGDDVTVRYFSGESAVTSQAAPFSTTPTTK